MSTGSTTHAGSFDAADLPMRSGKVVLRRLRPDDRERIATLANDERIAATTARLPHPYTLADADEFLTKIVPNGWLEGTSFILGIAPAADGVADDAASIVGVIGLEVSAEQKRAELGFWIGVDFWGKGYTTDAARGMLALAFGPLGLERVHAHHQEGNGASGRVQEKAGMVHEGVLRKHIVKKGRRLDYICYGVLREEWLASRAAAAGEGAAR